MNDRVPRRKLKKKNHHESIKRNTNIPFTQKTELTKEYLPESQSVNEIFSVEYIVWNDFLVPYGSMFSGYLALITHNLRTE